MLEDHELREAAIKRLKDKRDFFSHLVVYVLVNALLVVIWYVSDNNTHFWPIWPIAGWGIGLVMHAWDTFGPGISEAAIQKEIRKGRGE